MHSLLRAPQVQAFLEAFADEFDLRRHIRLRTRVSRVDPLGPSGAAGTGPWAVTVNPLIGHSLARAHNPSSKDALIMCNTQSLLHRPPPLCVLGSLSM